MPHLTRTTSWARTATCSSANACARRRRELGLTQKEVVARLRRIGVVTTNKALSSLEHGAGLDVCKLPELARALDCSLTYLVGLTEDPASWEPDFEHWPGHRARRPTPRRRPTVAATADRSAGSSDRWPDSRSVCGPAGHPAAALRIGGHIRRISR